MTNTIDTRMKVFVKHNIHIKIFHMYHYDPQIQLCNIKT